MVNDGWSLSAHSAAARKTIRVASELAKYTLHTPNTAVFPALRTLHVQDATSSHGPVPLWDLVESFVAQYRLSGCPVRVFTPWPRYPCPNCSEVFIRQGNLDRHINDKHPLPNICSHCNDFDWPQGNNNLFQEHLASKHPGVTHTDAPISIPASRPPFISRFWQSRSWYSAMISAPDYAPSSVGWVPVTNPSELPIHSQCEPES